MSQHGSYEYRTRMNRAEELEMGQTAANYLWPLPPATASAPPFSTIH
jgi:hypothetical protein